MVWGLKRATWGSGICEGLEGQLETEMRAKGFQANGGIMKKVAEMQT